MIVTSALLAILAATGASAQRGGGRWNNPVNPPPAQTTPPPPPQPTTPPPPLGATQSMWGQCGGVDWEYATACPENSLCYNDGENEWYSQCIPEEDNPANNPPLVENPSVETRILTTIFDVPGPTPTVVTTYITIYTEAPQPSPQPPPPPPPGITITAVPDTPIPRYRRRT